MTAPHPSRVWILTDGKAGDEQPLIGIAEAMGCAPELRRVKPRPLCALTMPWGPIDPKDAPQKPGSPLAPPYPDICLATGRRAVAYLRALKRLSPQTFTVFFKDPRTKRHSADLVVLQRHDSGRDDGNALIVTTAPNRIAPERLAAIRQTPPADLASLPHPRLAVLIGGDSRHHRFTPEDIAAFVAGLQARLDAGDALMMTTSRRTPAALAQALRPLEHHPHVRLWTGSGDNPLLPYLALADGVIVTADSTNMIGDAATTGRPVFIFHPSGGHPKTAWLIDALSKEAAIRSFPPQEIEGSYPPVNSTRIIARTVLERWRATQSR